MLWSRPFLAVFNSRLIDNFWGKKTNLTTAFDLLWAENGVLPSQPKLADF